MTIRQEHWNTRGAFVRIRSAARPGSRFPDPDDYFAPRTTIQSKAASKLQVKEPELDLLTVETFRTRYDHTIKNNPGLMSRLPFLELTKLDGSKRRGLLVYAESWNPPPGCLRIISLDEYSTEKLTFITDSASVTYSNEVNDQWAKSVRDNRTIASSAKAKDTKSKEYDLPEELFADKKRGIFLDFGKVSKAIDHMDAIRRQKEAEKQEKPAEDAEPQGDGAQPTNFFLGTTGSTPASGAARQHEWVVATPKSMCEDVFGDDVTVTANGPTPKAKANAGSKRPGSAAGAVGCPPAKARREGESGSVADKGMVDLKRDIGVACGEMGALESAVSRPATEVWAAFIDLWAELSHATKCDLVRESRVTSIMKKLGTSKKQCRTNGDLVMYLERIEALLPHATDIITETANAVRIERATRQNGQRRAAVAAAFDPFKASSAFHAIMDLDWGPLPLSPTIAFRFHTMGVERCLEKDAYRGLRIMLLLRHDIEMDSAGASVMDASPDLALTQMANTLSLRSLSRHAIGSEESLLWQQKIDIESCLSYMLIHKTPTSEMENVIEILPEEECHEEAKDQIRVYRALVNPERAGEEACKHALQRAKVCTDNALFHVRYQRYGQDLKAACQNWLGQQMSSSLSTLRLTRLVEDVESLPKGLGSHEKWANAWKNAEDFRARFGGTKSALIDRASAAIQDNVVTSVELHQNSFDTILSAVSFRIEEGKFICDQSVLAQAKSAYATAFEVACSLRTFSTPAFFEEFKRVMSKQREVITFMQLMAEQATVDPENLESLAASLADITFLEKMVSSVIRRPTILQDKVFMSLVAETSGQVSTVCSEMVIGHLRHVLASMTKVYGEKAPGVPSFTTLCAGCDSDAKFVVAPDTQGTAEIHLTKGARLLPTCNVDLVLSAVDIAPSFLHGAMGLCQVMPVINAIKSLSASHKVSSPLLKGAELAKLVIPTNKTRKVELTNILDKLSETLKRLRDVRAKLESVARFSASDHELKSSLLISDVSQGSTRSWITTDAFDEIVKSLRTAVEKTQDRIIKEVVSFEESVAGKLTETSAALDSCFSADSMNTWDESAIKSICLNPFSVGIANLRDTTASVYKTLADFKDVDAALAANDVAKHGDAMSKATKHVSAVTAIVGLFRADKRDFCTKLVGTLCKPGAKLIPDQLADRLKAAAEGK